MTYDVNQVRALFPALNQIVSGSIPVFLNGPGGAQVPKSVYEAMSDYMSQYVSNLIKSDFFAVRQTREIVETARRYAAEFLNAPSVDEIVFGANMTTLTAYISRSISREWCEGDEIIVTDLDHYANVSFWVQAAQDRGVKVRYARIHPEDCTLDCGHLESLLSEKTRLVAFTAISNVCGSMVDVKRVVALAKKVGAMSYVDAVHYAPHFLPDVQDWDCDFCALSAYKFCAPHVGILYGKRKWLESLTPYKVEPAPTAIPDCWETGSKNYEGLAGFIKTIEYLSNDSSDIRGSLNVFYDAFSGHELQWSKAFLERAAEIEGMNLYGITDLNRLSERATTFAFTMDGHHPQAVSDYLTQKNIVTGAGNFYGIGVIETLGLSHAGGVVRAGALHYNTMEELERFFDALDSL